MMPVVTNSLTAKIGELCRLEIRNGKIFFTKPRCGSTKGNTKGGGKGRTDKECFRGGRIGHIRADCRAKTHFNGGPPKSAPKGKRVGSCEEEGRETSQNAPTATIDLGSFEVLSDHGDTVENDTAVDEFSAEATPTMPPLPPAPWFKKTRTSKHTEMHCGRSSSQCHGNDCRDGDESSFFDCWDGQSDIWQQADPWAQNAPKSVSRAKGCFSVNFPVCSVPKVGCVQPTVANYSSAV